MKSGAGALALDERRSVWRIVGSALVLYGRYPLLFVVLAVVVVAPYDLLVLKATGVGPLGREHRSFALDLLLNLVYFSLVGPFISALHTHAVVLAGEGVKPRLTSVAARGVRVLPVVMAVEIVANLGIYAGLLLLIPGIALMLRWAVAAQVAAIEHQGWMPALSRSHVLTAGYYWRIAGLFLLTAMPNLAIHLAARQLPLGDSTGIGSMTVAITIDTMTASFIALTLALLYFDLRARRDVSAEQAPDEQEPAHVLD